MNKLKIVFAGTPEFGLPALNALHQSHHELIAVYTQPDRPAGRGRKLQPSAVKQWALEHTIPVVQPLNFKDSLDVQALASLQPDVLIVIAYGLILPKTILTIPRFGCINVHASLLPRWRGASPIQQAILHGDKESGVTIMQMDVGMDTGDMLNRASCSITSTDTASTLHDKLAASSVEPLIATLNALCADRLVPMVQPVTGITYAPKITKEDALINWHATAAAIDQQIRAFNPWPIAYCYLDQELVRIHEAELQDLTHNAEPGSVLQITKTGLVIAAETGAIKIKKIQFAGGTVISIADCLNSQRAPLLQRGFQ